MKRLLHTKEPRLGILPKEFRDEESARAIIDRLRWPAGSVCPHCGGERPYKLTVAASSKRRAARKGLYKCRKCRRQFTVTVGTIFEKSHIPLSIWLTMIYVRRFRRDISVRQFQRIVRITYESAWQMARKIRQATEDPLLKAIVANYESFRIGTALSFSYVLPDKRQRLLVTVLKSGNSSSG